MKPPADPIRARRPSAPTRERAEADAQECVQAPTVVVPPETVRSVVARLAHAIQWGNWDMGRRVLADAERQTDEAIQEILEPLDRQPVERLTELAGLSPALVRGLRVVNSFARRPVTIREVVRYGEDGLRTHESFGPDRAAIVFRAIRRAQRTRMDRIRKLLCWEVVC